MGGTTAARTTVGSGATATLSVPTGALTLGRTLSIASGATATLDGNGTVSGGGGGTGVISNEGVLLISGNSTIMVAVINGASGAITKSSSGTTAFSAQPRTTAISTVAAGTLNLSGTFTSYTQATDVLTGGAYHLEERSGSSAPTSSRTRRRSSWTALRQRSSTPSATTGSAT